jgi:thiol-disulfide isomerase/thioredoxin
MKTLLLLLAFAFASPVFADEGKCPRMNPKMLDEITANRGGKLKIVFFASWCSACKDHLVAKPEGPTILLGVFDKRERLEEVVQTLNLQTECYTDDGVAEMLGVKSLPAEQLYTAKP